MKKDANAENVNNILKIPDISVIVSMYNEEEVIDAFFNEVNKVLSELKNYSYEIICINDGSRDNTLNMLKSYAQKDKHIKVISFSRNFGKEKAMYAGLSECSGRCAMPMDADLQDPTELIHKFIKKWEEGFQNIYGVRTDRSSEGFFKRFTAGMFYKLSCRMADVPLPANAGDYRLIDRKIIDNIKQIKDRRLFMKYIFNWPGYKSCGVEYTRKPRAAGTTKWNYWKLWNFALDGITASTTLPLRLWTYAGGLIASVSFVYTAYIVLRTFIYGRDVPGYASLLVAVLFFGGLQLMALGVIGEYLGRVLEEVRERPLYIINEKINFGGQ